MSDATDFGGEHQTCSNWKELAEWLEEFPQPKVAQDDEGEPMSVGWIFRGQRRSSYGLEPKIERIDTRMEWGSQEVLIEKEFKERAAMHLASHLIPNNSLSWLALMQHWGIPTRLLDFTHSPFVALYFAVRGGELQEQSVRLWAIDTQSLSARFEEVARAAWRADLEAKAQREHKPRELKHVALSDPAMFATPRDVMRQQTEYQSRLVVEALEAQGTRREEQERSGCVSVASPPSFNPRLASQQGVFLVNCTEGLPLRESLRKMMKDWPPGWCKTADIDAGAASDIEQRLFQMNIHDQSLFPDLEGLAGLINQRLRLHWG